MFRYMAHKTDCKSPLEWTRLADRNLLRNYIQKLDSEVKCGSSMILNTLQEISRAASYALEKESMYTFNL